MKNRSRRTWSRILGFLMGPLLIMSFVPQDGPRVVVHRQNSNPDSSASSEEPSAKQGLLWSYLLRTNGLEKDRLSIIARRLMAIFGSRLNTLLLELAFEPHFNLAFASSPKNSRWQNLVGGKKLPARC